MSLWIAKEHFIHVPGQPEPFYQGNAARAGILARLHNNEVVRLTLRARELPLTALPIQPQDLEITLAADSASSRERDVSEEPVQVEGRLGRVLREELARALSREFAFFESDLLTYGRFTIDFRGRRVIPFST